MPGFVLSPALDTLGQGRDAAHTKCWGTMKQYKLAAWPDLPSAFQGMPYRRMLHQMSQRFVSVPQLMHESGLARSAVVRFLRQLGERSLLAHREHGEPDSMFGTRSPMAWLRRTFSLDERA